MKQIIKSIAKYNLSVLLICFVFALLTNAQVNQTQKWVFIKIEVKGMACPYCAFGMQKEFKKVAGVDNVEIKLEEGLVYISTPISQKPTTESLKQIIIDAGFTPGGIIFSEKAFKHKDDE